MATHIGKIYYDGEPVTTPAPAEPKPEPKPKKAPAKKKDQKK